MVRRQDGPGGYQIIFPLGHRKSKADIVRVELLTEADRVSHKKSSKQKTENEKRNHLEKQNAKKLLRSFLSNDTKSAEVFVEHLSPTGCKDLIAWSLELKCAKLGRPPETILGAFKLPARPVLERCFEAWFCHDVPEERDAATSRLRRQAREILLEKAKENFVSPHREVDDFITQISAFRLFEIAFTRYDATSISKLSQALRRSAKALKGS